MISLSPKLYPISVKCKARMQGMKRAYVEFEILGAYIIVIASRWRSCLFRMVDVFDFFNLFIFIISYDLFNFTSFYLAITTYRLGDILTIWPPLKNRSGHRFFCCSLLAFYSVWSIWCKIVSIKVKSVAELCNFALSFFVNFSNTWRIFDGSFCVVPLSRRDEGGSVWEHDTSVGILVKMTW